MHLEETPEPEEDQPAEVDFFTEHESFDNLSLEPQQVAQTKVSSSRASTFNNEAIATKSSIIESTPNMLMSSSGPSVKLDSKSGTEIERKSTIGGRKVQPKRAGVSYP